MFINKISDSLNDIEINVYELDNSNNQSVDYLESYLTLKIKSMKMHQELSMDDVFNVPTLKPEFIEEINRKIKKSSYPAESQIKWFDVRRSRVAEFMSQFLLEKEYRCQFHNEADKRLTQAPYEADQHARGVDVTGILLTEKAPKFVVCEVKASKESRIPCSSAASLLTDISHAYNNADRIFREIDSYYQNLGTALESKEKAVILEFLISILSTQNSRTAILDNIVFIPFLIRNNPEIISKKNLKDFRDFKQSDFAGADIKGVIWSVNFDIDKFSEDIYNKALNM